MKKLILFLLILIISFNSCEKISNIFKSEYTMKYYQESQLQDKIIYASDDIAAFDEAYKWITALKRTENLLISKGISNYTEPPNFFSLYKNGKQIYIDSKKENEIKEKWQKFEK